MINITHANNIDEAFIDICKSLYSHGKEVSPRGLKTKELQNFLVEFDANPECIITVPERNLDFKYLEASSAPTSFFL